MFGFIDINTSMISKLIMTITDAANILDIHRYLMIKKNIKYCSGLSKKYLLHYQLLVDL